MFLFYLKDTSTFQSQLEKIYTNQMYPLSAASMDQGSYTRAYEYIVRYNNPLYILPLADCWYRLHMLKELEQGVNKLKLLETCEVDTESKKELVTLWNERFQFIQVTYTAKLIQLIIYITYYRPHFVPWNQF